MEDALKKYDKFLRFKTRLDGTKSVYRQSPFSSSVEFNVFDIQNQFIGKGLWVLQKITLMDSQRFDIAGRVFEVNRNVKRKEHDTRMSREIANMMMCDNIII
jgi:hypothetical protein